MVFFAVVFMSGGDMKRGFIAIVFFLPFVSATAWGDYLKGNTAFQAGNFQEARDEWLMAAQKGDAKSFMRLGRFYEEGKGALQDFIKAHAMYNLAASLGGDDEAVKARDSLAENMPQEDISKAHLLAKSWVANPASIGDMPNLVRPKDVKYFNGKWALKFGIPDELICQNVQSISPIKINNGKWSMYITGGGDGGLSLLYGKIDATGALNGYASGQYVGAFFKGNLRNDGTGSGHLQLVGEGNCFMPWTAKLNDR